MKRKRVGLKLCSNTMAVNFYGPCCFFLPILQFRNITWEHGLLLQHKLDINPHMFPSSSVTVWKLHSLFHSQSPARFQNHHRLPPSFQHLSSSSVPVMKLMLLFQPVLGPRMTQNWTKWVHGRFWISQTLGSSGLEAAAAEYYLVTAKMGR